MFKPIYLLLFVLLVACKTSTTSEYPVNDETVEYLDRSFSQLQLDNPETDFFPLLKVAKDQYNIARDQHNAAKARNLINQQGELVIGKPKTIRSISITKPDNPKEGSTGYFDKSGRLIYTITKQGDELHYFYDKLGRVKLKIKVDNNHYDTIYQYNKYTGRRLEASINYNIKRKQFDDTYSYYALQTYSRKKSSNTQLTIHKERYTDDYKTDLILPDGKDSMQYLLNDKQELYTSDKDFEPKIIDNLVYLQPKWFILDHRSSFRTELSFKYSDRMVSYSYYKGQPELQSKLQVQTDYFPFLDSLIAHVPNQAKRDYQRLYAEQNLRDSIVQNKLYGQTINVKKSDSLEKFTPLLWHLVSWDKGALAGYQNPCIVAGYNTPLKHKEWGNKRALAIYEQVADSLFLRKLSFTAIETFNDSDDDYLFTLFDEVNFSVSVGNRITIHYDYMRGEASYTYSLDSVSNRWRLESYASDHRTCCALESSSYSYIDSSYHSSSTSIDDEDGGDDYAINKKEYREPVYMDELDVRKYDYNETGLLIK